MLSQNFIPRSLQQTTDLITGTQELISELQDRLQAGEYFDNRKLTEITNELRIVVARVSSRDNNP